MLSFSFFSLYFINTFPCRTVPSDYPHFPSSSHSPNFPTLYLLPAIEHYPLEPTFCTVTLVIAFGFRIRSLIQLPFCHSHTHLSRYSTANPIHHLAFILTAPTSPSFQPFYQFRLYQGPNE